MTDNANYPMQTFLRTVIVYVGFKRRWALIRRTCNVYRIGRSAARQIVVATVPILIVYPFLQRYFISGIKLGAVKE